MTPDDQIAAWRAKGLTIREGGPPTIADVRAFPCDVVDVPIPPSVNNLFATVRGRRIKSKRYKAWLEAVAPTLAKLRKPTALPVGLRVIVVGKLNRQRDLDNLLKPIGDALVAAGILPGDSVACVCEWLIRYVPDDGEPVARIGFTHLDWRKP